MQFNVNLLKLNILLAKQMQYQRCYSEGAENKFYEGVDAIIHFIYSGQICIQYYLRLHYTDTVEMGIRTNLNRAQPWYWPAGHGKNWLRVETIKILIQFRLLLLKFFPLFLFPVCITQLSLPFSLFANFSLLFIDLYSAEKCSNVNKLIKIHVVLLNFM